MEEIVTAILIFIGLVIIFAIIVVIIRISRDNIRKRKIPITVPAPRVKPAENFVTILAPNYEPEEYEDDIGYYADPLPYYTTSDYDINIWNEPDWRDRRLWIRRKPLHRPIHIRRPGHGVVRNRFGRKR